jgi:hypothetical protein
MAATIEIELKLSDDYWFLRLESLSLASSTSSIPGSASFQRSRIKLSSCELFHQEV